MRRFSGPHIRLASLLCFLPSLLPQVRSFEAFDVPNSRSKAQTTRLRAHRPSFADRLAELRHYQQEHGHTRVPRRYPSLGPWVSKQRQLYKRRLLDDDRVAELEEVGFCWNVTATRSTSSVSRPNSLELQWWERYRQLQDLLSSTPSSTLADVVPPRSSLGTWLRKQRQQRDSLREKHLQALERLDPQWCMSRHDLMWERRLQELLQYRRQHGDCCVPISYQPNPSLAHWVSNQRKSRDKMSPERKRRLDEVGFVWNKWEYDFSERWEMAAEQQEFDMHI